MAVPGVLSDYIAKNYKRLLVCVAPPPTHGEGDGEGEGEGEGDSDARTPPTHPTAQHGADGDDECGADAAAPSTPTARRRRRSTLTRHRRARRRTDEHGRLMFEQDGQQLVREDPFRGCVSSRSVGPRDSGDFVLMGCMHV